MKIFYCPCCKKDLGSFPVLYFVAYDKCREKTCPDCGKVRKLGIVKESLQLLGSSKCIKCGKMSQSYIDKICAECFHEREEKKGCICYTKGAWYCSLCEEVHACERFCEKCFQKQTTSSTFLRIILPTAVISLIIGFVLGWLFFKIKEKRTKKP